MVACKVHSVFVYLQASLYSVYQYLICITYEIRNQNIRMLLYKTPGCFSTQHGDVFIKNMGMFCILKPKDANARNSESSTMKHYQHTYLSYILLAK